MASKLDRAFLLTKLERIRRVKPKENLDHEFEKMGIAPQLLSVAELDQSQQYHLIRAIERVYRQHSPTKKIEDEGIEDQGTTHEG